MYTQLFKPEDTGFSTKKKKKKSPFQILCEKNLTRGIFLFKFNSDLEKKPE